MPDLHGWITQQVAATEDAARKAAALCGCHPPAPSWSFGDEVTNGRILVVDDPHPGVKRKLGRCWGSSYEGLFMAEHIARHDPAAVLRRCEADRRVLERHRMNPDADSRLDTVACDGCGRWGEFDYPNTANLNDCPELLDLAHAHGITEEILAVLDRPELPPPGHHPAEWHAYTIRDALAPRTPIADVPASLRGPDWTGDPK